MVVSASAPDVPERRPKTIRKVATYRASRRNAAKGFKCGGAAARYIPYRPKGNARRFRLKPNPARQAKAEAKRERKAIQRLRCAVAGGWR
jgi:hypothetical protein